jgi:arylsulfatase A-like enzyme
MRTRWPALAGVLALTLLAPGGQRAAVGAVAAPPGAPNVLVIVTDDQRTGTMFAMPKTLIIGDKAIEYLDAFEAADDARPWFTYLATFAPHLPRTPEPQYAGTTFAPWARSPAVNENVADKPQYVRWRPTATDAAIQQVRTEQLRTLKSVDDMVDRVLRHLQARGELDNTLVLYSSDNGYAWAEHRILDLKFVPYTESIQVPFLARWPGHLAPGTTDDRFVANIDLKPTVLAAAGVPPDPAYPVDGRSFLSPGGRDRLLTEYFFDDANLPNLQTWASTRTRTYQYVENYNQPELGGGTFREYYDLVNDPWMLTNLYRDGNPGNDPPVGPLSSALAADRQCSGAACP